MISRIILKLPQFCAEYRLMSRAMLFLQASLRYTFVVTISIIRLGVTSPGFRLYLPKVPWNVMVPDSLTVFIVDGSVSSFTKIPDGPLLLLEVRRPKSINLQFTPRYYLICAFPIPIATPVFSKPEYIVCGICFSSPETLMVVSNHPLALHAKQISIIFPRVMAF